MFKYNSTYKMLHYIINYIFYSLNKTTYYVEHPLFKSLWINCYYRILYWLYCIVLYWYCIWMSALIIYLWFIHLYIHPSIYLCTVCPCQEHGKVLTVSALLTLQRLKFKLTIVLVIVSTRMFSLSLHCPEEMLLKSWSSSNP